MTPVARGRLEERLAAEAPVRAVRAALEGVEAWLVGGTIRDALLGRAVRDVDVAIRGDAEPAARALARALGGPAFPLSDEFGSWRVIDPGGGYTCDISPLQAESIEGDLALRDFTVNAMGAELAGGPLIDPLGGAGDLGDSLLRVTAAEAYARDPLRPLRLVRLVAELGLRPDPDTERITAAAAPSVTRAAPERVFGELRRLVAAPGCVEGMELAGRLGLTAAVLPEVEALKGVEQSRYHHLDVYEHTLQVLAEQVRLEEELAEIFGALAEPLDAVLAEPLADELTRREALRLAALLHDIGKPPTRAVREDGRVTFLGHDELGAEMAAAICSRLRTSGKLRDFVTSITRAHLVLGFLVHRRPLSRREVYRYMRRCEPVAVDVTLLTCADRRATRGRKAEEAIAAHLELARELMGPALEWHAEGPPQPSIRGDELARELGIAPGPDLGRALEALREAEFAGEVASREDALRHARAVTGEAAE